MAKVRIPHVAPVPNPIPHLECLPIMLIVLSKRIRSRGPPSNANGGIQREAKKERLGYAGRLLEFTDECLDNPVEMVTDSVEKRELRKKAWAPWGRMGNIPTGSPYNPELRFSADVVKMARIGKEFLIMAREGGHFSAGKMIKIATKQKQQTSRCDCANFDPYAYQKCLQSYVSRWEMRNLQ